MIRNVKKKNNSRHNEKTRNEIQRLLQADCDYDYGFMLMLERKKLQRMAEYFSKADITYSDAAKAKEMSLCVRLLDIILDEEKQTNEWTAEVVCHNDICLQKDANGKTFIAELVYNGLIPDFPKYVNLRNASRFMSSAEYPKGPYESAEEQKSRTEHFKKDVREAKAWHLYNLIREYKMLKWWN